MIHTQPLKGDHSLWRKETRYCFNFITFCKKEQVHFSALTFILPSLFFLLQWAYQHFLESLNHVVFLYLTFSTRIDLFSIFFIFFRKLKVTRRIPQLLLVVQEKRGSFVFCTFCVSRVGAWFYCSACKLLYMRFSFSIFFQVAFETDSNKRNQMDRRYMKSMQTKVFQWFLFLIWYLCFYIYLFEFPNVIW